LSKLLPWIQSARSLGTLQVTLIASSAKYFYYHGAEYRRASLGNDSTVMVKTGLYKGIFIPL